MISDDQRGSIRVDGFREVIVHTCVNAALTLLHQGMCRHRDDRDVFQPRVTTDHFGRDSSQAKEERRRFRQLLRDSLDMFAAIR
jgi:hypothetical protein